MSDHLVPLGETGWRIWRDSVLRSAGFPAHRVSGLRGPDLVARAERGDTDFATAFARERKRAEAALVGSVDDRFLEAVTWQNPRLARNWLHRVPTLDPDNHGLRREQLLTIANYLQRYCLKNDSIGFFGPVVWARWTEGARPLVTRVGEGLSSWLHVHFEVWAIDALARVLAADPGVRPWLRPRVVASCVVNGTELVRPHGPPLALGEADKVLLARCDGTSPVLEIARVLSRPPGEVLDALDRWRDEGVVHLGLEGPSESWPERTLRARLAAIGDAPTAARTLGALDELVAARDRVAAAAGDATALARAMNDLDETFRRLTGEAPTRRDGMTYAGRTLVYPESRRDVDVELGAPLLETLSAPLGLVLDSARWLVGRIGDHYAEVFLDVFLRCGGDAVPLARFLGMATPHLFVRSTPLRPVARAVAEFQEKWARVLAVPDGARRHHLRAEDIADLVRHEFPPLPAPWSAARHHCPDILLTAGGDVVLGELHIANNTVENRVFLLHHDDPDRLMAAIDADHAGRRTFAVPTKQWPRVNSRTYPPLLSTDYTYWCLHDDSTGAPGPVLPSADMTVHRAGDRLVVRSGARELDLFEVLGEQLSFAVVNAFRPLGAAAHHPRVTIDRLVMHRESWRFDATDVEWVRRRDPAERFRLAQRWRLDHGLPMRAFYRVPALTKPIFVDFGAIVLCERMAKAVRGADRVTLTEMLPDTDELWLTDAAGDHYTAELRIVALAQEPVQANGDRHDR
ncbi:lantibiotic dehydratase [Actinophytocola oryzae]|uniref:Lantibiotic biosynthesis dehydratase-like protein n=1 Tax=Actinophytocola oryzae TaxID=502181 RepID=A0A4R7VHQ1_9PSEU|nr:lantibiotic dehydratase [Actinophytocola oryzae]TDV48685.1 lantibiotic biosynthesis dehydratase-like protein [Actinophytocola oryzae]